MKLSEIRTFLAVVETGNLNRAANVLHITQSTVYARLNNLEQELGQTLFHRRKSGAELTSAGFRFERYAQLMTDIWRQAQQETALPADVESICNLGCHPDLWSGLGEQIFTAVKSSNQSVARSSWPGTQSEIDRWLSNGLIDFALCYSTTLKDNWTAYNLKAETLIQVSTRKRELMRWDPEYIYVDSGEEFRKSHAAAYPDGDTPTVSIASSVWALQYLLENGGSAYLPTRIVDQYLNNETLFAVTGATVFYRPVYLVVRNSAKNDWPWFDKFIEPFLK